MGIQAATVFFLVLVLGQMMMGMITKILLLVLMPLTQT